MTSEFLAGTVSTLFAKVDALESEATRIRNELEEARAESGSIDKRRHQLEADEVEQKQQLKELYQYVF